MSFKAQFFTCMMEKSNENFLTKCKTWKYENNAIQKLKPQQHNCNIPRTHLTQHTVSHIWGIHMEHLFNDAQLLCNTCMSLLYNFALDSAMIYSQTVWTASSS